MRCDEMRCDNNGAEDEDNGACGSILGKLEKPASQLTTLSTFLHTPHDLIGRPIQKQIKKKEEEIHGARNCRMHG